MSKYRRIKYEDRRHFYALSKRGSSQESIAEVLGVSQSAVSREMHRNRGQRGYRFKQAEAKAQARQAIRNKPRKLTVLLRCKIEAKLRQMRWSPEQISGWLSEQGIKLSHERIYQMIWDDKRDGGNLWRTLRRRGKRYNKRAGRNAGRGLIPDIRYILSVRPLSRAKPAWEMGRATPSSAPHTKAACSRWSSAKPNSLKSPSCRVRPPAQHRRQPGVASSLSATSCTPSPSTTERNSPRIRIRPCTENQNLLRLRPDYAWERGLNENTNGLIRDFFPKGTDFSTISSAEVAKVERLLNARPRKSLRFRSPQEVFHSLVFSF